MEKEKRNDKVQVRITETDRRMIRTLQKLDPEFGISKFFRESLRAYYDAIVENGIGDFTIGE